MELMQLPQLNLSGQRREMMDRFGGYDRSPKPAENTWHDQLNMSSENFPVLSTRRYKKIATFGEEGGGAQMSADAGLINKGAMATIVGSNLVYGGEYYDMGLSTAAEDCPKQLVSMGAYLLIWPDLKYFNTEKPSDRGKMENYYNEDGNDVTVTVEMCKQDGSQLGDYTTSRTAPQSPTNGDLWLDTSNSKVPVLKEWSDSSSMWVTIPTTYLKLTAPGIATGFKQYDGVTISGFTGADGERINGSNVLTKRLKGNSTEYVVITGVIASGSFEQTGPITISRTVPDMDFVTECDNRVWGCKYGISNGVAVNEIYASKLGDFKNWNCFMGLSTDSFVASRGSDGVFTGAITHQGHPLFFRENCVEKVYPSASGAHQIVTAECRGVQKGCWRSLAIVGETLFYKSRHCVCAYTGSLPVSVSDALGDDPYNDARAGAAGDYYYISMHDANDETDANWHFFIFDTIRGIWSREGSTKAMMFAARNGRIYYINEPKDGAEPSVYDNKVMRYYTQTDDVTQSELTWSVTSNVIGFDLAENEYVSRFVIRCDTVGTVRLSVEYDEDGSWINCGTTTMNGLGSFVVPVPPRRCDHMRFRLNGNAPCKIYSIAKYIESGSDVMW